MGASSYTYCEATWSQSLPDWIGSHVRAFEHMGKAPMAAGHQAGEQGPIQATPCPLRRAFMVLVGTTPAAVDKPVFFLL